MQLKKTTREVIKKDSVASIETEGLLGAKYVSVSFGSKASDRVQDGDTIRSEPPFDYTDLAQKAGDIMESVSALVKDSTMVDDARRTMAEAKAGAKAFREDMEALQHHWLLRGAVNRRAEELRESKKDPRPPGDR